MESRGIEIESSVCRACGRCVEQCPVGAITLGATARIDPDECIGCGHCGAVCPHGAVHSERGSFTAWSAPKLDFADVYALLAGRRSVRRYQPGTLEPDLIEQSLSVAAYSATASNARDVRAVVLQGEPLRQVAAGINGYYLNLARWLDNPLLRPLLWLTPARPYLKNPKRLDRLRARVVAHGPGQDWIFFDAPAVVILSTPRKNRRFGRVNAVIAAEQVQTCAASLGLGSCWIGYAEVALRARRRVAELAGVPRDHEPQCVFTLGRPAVSYRNLPARSPLTTVWLGRDPDRAPGPRAASVTAGS